MKITLDLSPEQTAAVARANQESNAGSDKPPTDDVFAMDIANNAFDDLIAVHKQIDLNIAKEKLQSVSDKLSSADLAQVIAVAEKYAAS